VAPWGNFSLGSRVWRVKCQLARAQAANKQDDFGVFVSMTWSSGKSFTVSDWGCQALGAQNDQSWNWRSQNPGNTDEAQSSRNGYGINGRFSVPSGYPANPNELCQTQMQYHSSVAWQSQGLQTAVANIDSGTTSQHILDLWCYDDFGPVCLGTMSINLAAVIPIPIANMVLNGGQPVVGGNQVTGFIFLKSGALMDIPIALTSSNELVAPRPLR
jgi:hypothetical protein